MESKILHVHMYVKCVHIFKSIKHELQSMRSGSILGFGDSKVQIHSGSNSEFLHLIFD